MDQYTIGDLVMSSITFAELEYGVLCADDPAQAKEQFDILVKAAPVVAFDAAASTAYGPIRLVTRELKKDQLDELIAAHAVALNVTVVTNNADIFANYPGVKTENWVEAN